MGWHVYELKAVNKWLSFWAFFIKLRFMAVKNCFLSEEAGVDVAKFVIEIIWIDILQKLVPNIQTVLFFE